jgi:hypothetical protein
LKGVRAQILVSTPPGVFDESPLRVARDLHFEPARQRKSRRRFDCAHRARVASGKLMSKSGSLVRISLGPGATFEFMLPVDGGDRPG